MMKYKLYAKFRADLDSLGDKEKILKDFFIQILLEKSIFRLRILKM